MSSACVFATIKWKQLLEIETLSQFLVFQELWVRADTSGAVRGFTVAVVVLIYFPIIRCDKEWVMSTY